MDNERESLTDGYLSAIKKLTNKYQARANTQIHRKLATSFGNKILDVDGSRMIPLPDNSPRSKAGDRRVQKH